MKYIVVYNILHESVNFEPLYTLLFGIVVAVIVFFVKKGSSLGRVFIAMWLVIWTAAFFWIFFREKSELEECKELFTSGRFAVAEGAVEHFHPMPESGHDTERFLVNGVNFSYSDYDESHCGFNNTSSHGGPIRAGANVRISYNGKRILKVEVAIETR